nr:MAG TPA: hypothetical protein [Caudoviricetes sp.]
MWGPSRLAKAIFLPRPRAMRAGGGRVRGPGGSRR